MKCTQKTRAHTYTHWQHRVYNTKNTGKLWKFEGEKNNLDVLVFCCCCCGCVFFPFTFASASFFCGQTSFFSLLYVSYVDPVKYALVGYFFHPGYCILLDRGPTHTQIDENMMNKQIRIDSNRIQNNNRNEINADRLWAVWWNCLYLNSILKIFLSLKLRGDWGWKRLHKK